MDISKALCRHRDYVLSVVSGKATDSQIESSISRSWQRCVADFGLDPGEPRKLKIVDAAVLREHRDRIGNLMPIAEAEMANLYQQVAGSGHSVMLTDPAGVVLSHIGDPTSDENLQASGLCEGAIWSEEEQGTNGMGTCVVEKRPLIVHHSDHFLSSNLALTCTAAPILDPAGKLLAVLDASSRSIQAQQHTLALVNMSAKTVENRLFLSMFKNHFMMRFHSRPEFVNTLGEGLIVFRSDGTILAANRNALFQLDYETSEEICQLKIDDVFETTLPALLTQPKNGFLQAAPIYTTKHSRRFFAMVQLPESALTKANSFESPNAFTPEARPAARTTVNGDLDTLEFGDAHMAKNVRIARRVLDRDIPILLAGESGTGKGVFAKAMHMISNRAEKPFVAINCASIPESLIESELFGYKAGAFTGASRHGSPGKIVQADGGTLFLDEIGDMPLSLQARLLRVLEEKEVVPLGGHVPVTVDLRVISATHQDLPQMVTEGRFREDLYYRLQGIRITLPPLRERTDKYNLIRYLIEIESRETGPVQVDEEVFERLNSYYWPGNIRQLRNVLRTMLALRDSHRITVNDLVHDLFGEARLSKEAEPAEEAPTTAAAQDPLRNAERDALLRELELRRWNISSVAKRLNLSRNTLYRKMKRCNITPPR